MLSSRSLTGARSLSMGNRNQQQPGRECHSSVGGRQEEQVFSDTPEGPEACAIAFSLIEKAKANGLNVERYLLQILNILPDRFAVNSDADIRDLLPWSVDMKTQFSV